SYLYFFFFQAEDGIRDRNVTGVQTCALPISFLVAATFFALQTILTPVQQMLGELMTRRMDGLLQQRLIRTSLRSTGIGPLEDPAVLDALDEVSRWRSEEHTSELQSRFDLVCR